MMESDELDISGTKKVEVGVDSQSAVNSLILDYYKKFGRKRDLEQFFSLSTAQSDIKDPTSPFWRKMKSENDSSDSEGKKSKSESSREICRISIKCSVPELESSQDEDQSKTKSDSVSPPIIIEEGVNTSKHTDDESMKSDDNQSQKSYDALLLDVSTQKPFSPTSSITSQRKLEWDSLADVGYANESDRRASASSLSTLERLALHQQYSNNDTRDNIGPPTSHSTPLDENDKAKTKKGTGKKSTKIYNKGVDVVEVNVPSTSEAKPTQSINVNLTKHISFNVEKDGGVTIDNIKRDISISPEKKPLETAGVSLNYVRSDKEIQTSLIRTQEKSTALDDKLKDVDKNPQKVPIMINVNTLRRRLRRRKSKARRKLRPTKSLNIHKENLLQEKSGEQLSEAESFEYMPGHIYNQNHLKNPVPGPPNMSAGNKSSLESSGALTTDSSKGSKHSFTKDLEKSIKLLKDTLQKRFDDSEVKNKLIKEIVSRLLKSRYRDDDSSLFLSGLSFSSRKLGLKSEQTSSTSDANISEEKHKRPKKSILRVDKFDSNAVASTSQSVPNLLTATNTDKFPTSHLIKAIDSNTDSDITPKAKISDNACSKTSSEELYQKYLEALKREDAYKRHLRDKELFLKQKLTCSDNALRVPTRQDVKITNRIKDLMKDLTRNNYDDGSGDASKLEGGSNTHIDYAGLNAVRNQRSHSVFTLSSSPSECQKKPNVRKNQCDIRDQNEAGPSDQHPYHYCCCPHHYTNSRVGYADSSVQVNIKCQYEDTCTQLSKISTLKSSCEKCKPRNRGRVISDNVTGDIKYVCLCNEKPITSEDLGDNFLIYKCARLTNRGVQLEKTPSKISDVAIQCGDTYKHKNDDIKLICPPCKIIDIESSSYDNLPCGKKHSKSSQTNLKLYQEGSDTNTCFSDSKTSKDHRPISPKAVLGSECLSKNFVHEATRCLQTEISINPKINQDPSLADIKIITESDCAKLIGEQYRRIESSSTSKNTDSGQKAKDCTDVCASSEFGKKSSKYDDRMYDNKYCADFQNYEFGSMNEAFNRDKYTIPIQGTNMTLMVNLGSHEIKEPSIVNVDQGCVTDKADVVEQSTCIFDECSKSVQYESPKTMEIESSLPVDSNQMKEIGTQSDCTNIIGNTISFGTDIKSNTYPKNIQTNVRKPFCRSNTDTDKIEQVCWVHTKNTNKEADRQFIKKTMIDTDLKDDQRDLKCSTGVNMRPTCDCGCKLREDQYCKTKPLDWSKADTDKIGKVSFDKNMQKKYGSQETNTDELFRKKTTTERDIGRFQKDTTGYNKSPRCDCGSNVREGECCKKKLLTRSDVGTDKEEQVCSNKADMNRNDFETRERDTDEKCMKNLITESDTERVIKHSCYTNVNKSPRFSNKKDIGTQNDASVSPRKMEKDLKSCCSEKKSSKHSDSDDQNLMKSKKSPRKYPCSDRRDRSPPKVNIEHERLSKIISSNERNKCIVAEPKTSPRKSGYGSEKVCKQMSEDKSKVVFSPTISSGSEKSSKQVDGEVQKSSVIKSKQSLPKSSNACCQEETAMKPKDCCQPALSSDTENVLKNICVDGQDSATSKQKKSSPKYSCASEKSSKHICQKSQESIQEHTSKCNSDFEKPTQKNICRVTKPDENKPCTSSSDYYNAKETCSADQAKDPIIDMIREITKQYSKTDIEKHKRKKCFKEIMTVLHYLLETDESEPPDPNTCGSCTEPDIKSEDKVDIDCCSKSPEKIVQPPATRPKSGHSKICTESSEIPASSDLPCTSSDSATCKVLNKIKKECEKYHQKRCKSGRKCYSTSTTSVNCDQCKKVHHCLCKGHKCRRSKNVEKLQKKCIAYNLIIQTSESMISEEKSCEKKCRPLKEIVVKVPKYKPFENICKETSCRKETVYKVEKPRSPRCENRSRSCPNESELSSAEEFLKKTQQCTVREYLERNRPDFVENCAQRQNCLKFVSDVRANERSAKRDLLSLHVERQPDLTNMSSDELRRLAMEIGLDLRRKKPAPKFISEREMKKHSEKIYKTLPEVVQKKEEKKKENIKKTNLLMANIFRKNLQKQILRGSVNLSNYNTVIKI